jgi:hypothetical protein
VVCECEGTGLGIASGRALSPTQGFRFYSSRLAMRAVLPLCRGGRGQTIGATMLPLALLIPGADVPHCSG